MAAHTTVSTQTSGHRITIADDSLTIQGDSEMLSPDETLQLLETLLIWQYGLEKVPPVI